MPKQTQIVLLAAMFSVAVGGSAQLPPPRSPNPNPWSGTWKLDYTRSSPGIQHGDAPERYRLTLGPAFQDAVTLKWEIPELGEIVEGLTDGKPMVVHRDKPSPGLTLSVQAEGKAQLVYTVRRNNVLLGGGRMMLVDNGKAWVDLTWPADRLDLASELVYVKE